MKTLLTDLDLSEVSLVDKGANPGALITLYKRDEQGREIIDVSKVKLQNAIAKSRLTLAKNAEHDQKTHGNRGGGGGVDSSSRFVSDAKDASDEGDLMKKEAEKFEQLYNRYRGNTQQGRAYFKVKEGYERAAEFYDRAAEHFNAGREMAGELALERAERWSEAAEQLARSLGK